MTSLPCITIRPPWSWVIAETAALTALGVPAKVENRGRKVADKWIGQQVGIHAGATWSAEGGRDPRVQRAWRTFGAAVHHTEPNPTLAAIGDHRTGCVGALRRDGNLWIDRGAVVAVATLAGCHEAADDGGYTTCCPPWGDKDYPRDPFDSRQPVRRAWHVVFADVRRLPAPVDVRGALALPWRLPEAETALVFAQIERVAA